MWSPAGSISRSTSVVPSSRPSSVMRIGTATSTRSEPGQRARRARGAGRRTRRAGAAAPPACAPPAPAARRRTRAPASPPAMAIGAGPLTACRAQSTTKGVCTSASSASTASPHEPPSLEHAAQRGGHGARRRARAQRRSRVPGRPLASEGRLPGQRRHRARRGCELEAAPETRRRRRRAAAPPARAAAARRLARTPRRVSRPGRYGFWVSASNSPMGSVSGSWVSQTTSAAGLMRLLGSIGINDAVARSERRTVGLGGTGGLVGRAPAIATGAMRPTSRPAVVDGARWPASTAGCLPSPPTRPSSPRRGDRAATARTPGRDGSRR